MTDWLLIETTGAGLTIQQVMIIASHCSIPTKVFVEILCHSLLCNEQLIDIYVIQREFLKTRYSRCMLYRHNAAIGTD